MNEGRDSAMLSLILILTPKPKNISSAKPDADTKTNIGEKKYPNKSPDPPSS